MKNVVSYCARWIFTATRPPLQNGIVVVRRDKIEIIEPAGTRKADVDFGNVAIIPGLVNVHTHLDLSGALSLIPPTDPEHFTDWLKGVIAYRRNRTAEQVQQDIREGLAECLKAGTTLVGDIASGGESWDSLCAAETRAIVYSELIGLDPDKLGDVWQKTGFVSGTNWFTPPDGIVPRFNTPTCKWAISPHAPYTVNGSTMRAMNALSPRLATHVAESHEEKDLLEHRNGSFVTFLSELGVYRKEAFAESWEQFLSPFLRSQNRQFHLLIHGNYLPTDFPFQPYQSLVYCPRTHAAFGHPPHPFRKFMKRGVRVCLGTDSLASNPDLDILAEARFLKQRYPDFDGETLLKMVTLFGAEALGWADECGSLEVGKSADFVAVPLPNRVGDPYDLLFATGDHGERKTMFRGEWRN